jgi:hypothetical protein
MNSVKIFILFVTECHNYIYICVIKSVKRHEKLINYLIMSPLVKNIIKGAAAVGGAYLVYTGVKKVAPTALSVDPFAGNTSKTWIWLAGFVAVGAGIIALIGKVAKVPFLRN